LFCLRSVMESAQTADLGAKLLAVTVAGSDRREFES